MAEHSPQDPRVVELYHQACNIGQSTRNDFIQLLSNPDIANVVVGTCVRVLLELQDYSEDYMVARVQGIEIGDTYSGFSQNANQATTIHLRLQLPSRFSGGNGNLYQLNSISNSPLTRHEVEVWLGLTANEGRPDAQSFINSGNRLRTVVPARARRGQAVAAQQAQQPANGSGSDLRRNNTSPNTNPPQPAGNNRVGGASPISSQPPTAIPNGQTIGVTVAKRSEGSGRSAAKAEMASEALQVTPRDLVYQMITKEKSQEATLFKRNCKDMRTAELRTLERDVAEYLDRVREAITNNQQRCVVCMDQIPTVIIMPCRHRVLCRWCTLKVESCPMCRGVATELFEPIEQ